MLLVLFGCASIAQYTLSKHDPDFDTNLLTINLTFGFAVTLSALITSKSSGEKFVFLDLKLSLKKFNSHLYLGAHLNPAVSFATLLIGKMSILRFLIYCLAQFIGAFLAAAIVYM